MQPAEKSKTYSTLEFETSSDNEDLACWLVLNNGASGCEVEQAGDGVLVKVNFRAGQVGEKELTELKALFEEYGLAGCLGSMRIKNQEETDWLAKWKEGFEPFNIGDGLVVSPPWAVKDVVKGERELVIIEPAMAFGTGLHQTTRFCLQSIQNHFDSLGTEILDVGTGSGILAIACVLLARRQNRSINVLAVDNDPVAIKAAAENVDLNKAFPEIELIIGTTDAIKGRQFDSILSNMTAEDIVALLPEYKLLLRQSGLVLCAGILAEKAHLVKEAAARHGMSEIVEEPAKGWVGIVLQNNS